MDIVSTTLQILISGLSLGGLYALMALGLALVYGILKLVNFAYGELIMVGGYTLLVLGTTDPLLWAVAAVICIGMATLTSLLLERIAFRPVRQASANTMLITSFAVSALLQNSARLFVNPRPQAVETIPFFTESFRIGDLFFFQRDILTIVVSIALLVLLTIFLRRTTLGIALRAAADDFTMARVLGVRANQVIATAFAISGLLAGVVAILWVGRVGTVTPDLGATPVLIAFVAIVIGGMDRLVGAVIGGFLIGFLSTGLQFILPQSLLEFRQAFLFFGVILVLLFKPEGLISNRRAIERV
jgi:branched-chain amino acid transport system permease protein